MSLAVAFERVRKHYLGSRAYRSLRDDLASIAVRVVGLRTPPRQVIRALDDVSFEISEGAAVALMGPNASGKTTALKLISRITYPTEGVVRVRGRVGALIEVGTGLHPELTGRENMHLYGRILGLSRRQINRRFEEIVEFAEVGAAIDQPLKHYSSGMQLRLGFSLASHVEPDVLLVDEAVSVGDAGFQYRCVERMAELLKTGITLLFVSHVPSLVASLCRTGILLDAGRVAFIGPVSDVINSYLRLTSPGPAAHEDASSIEVRSWDFDFHAGKGRFLGDLTIRVNLDVPGKVANPRFGLSLSDGRPGSLVTCSMLADGFRTGEVGGRLALTCEMEELPLEPGPYQVWLSAMSEGGMTYLVEPKFLGYAMLGNGRGSKSMRFAGTTGYGAVRVPYRWDLRIQDDGVP